jgi:hypothetical protein
MTTLLVPNPTKGAVVFLKGRPVWLAVFYGRLEGADVEVQLLYSFLQRAVLLKGRGSDEGFALSATEQTWHQGR